MSKESAPTPLQALERIKSHYKDKVCIDVLDDFDIIETALKEGETDKTLRICLTNANAELIKENEKFKKAIKIIKEHRLDIDWFLQFVKQGISYQHYVYCVEQSNNAFAKRFLLNKEEYELLKEIFD